jgi:nucleoside-diphosphate-sugar epimerase
LFVAVTGASGRIGSTLVRELVDAGHEVRAIDRTAPESAAGLDTVQVDVCDYEQLLAAVRETDALVHLAGVPSPNHDQGHVVHNTNVVGSFNALAAAAETGIDRVCLASSINAIGGAFSRRPRYDYFPVDEQHPTYTEDPYSLSKWIMEQQADSVARRYPTMTIASFRIHGAAADRERAATQTEPGMMVNHLWGYVRFDAIARACLLALQASWQGHEVFNIVADDTVVDTDSAELARLHWPEVPVRKDFHGNSGFYDCGKAERVLGWKHTV